MNVGIQGFAGTWVELRLAVSCLNVTLVVVSGCCELDFEQFFSNSALGVANNGFD